MKDPITVTVEWFSQFTGERLNTSTVTVHGKEVDDNKITAYCKEIYKTLKSRYPNDNHYWLLVHLEEFNVRKVINLRSGKIHGGFTTRTTIKVHGE